MRTCVKQRVYLFNNGFSARLNRPLFRRHIKQFNKLTGSKVASNLANRTATYTVGDNKNAALLWVIRNMKSVCILVYRFNAGCRKCTYTERVSWWVNWGV